MYVNIGDNLHLNGLGELMNFKIPFQIWRERGGHISFMQMSA